MSNKFKIYFQLLMLK